VSRFRDSLEKSCRFQALFGLDHQERCCGKALRPVSGVMISPMPLTQAE
jgi:hypothetical protein